MFARGLKQVFGMVQFVDKAARGLIAFEGGEVFAATSFVGCGGLFLLL